MLHHDTNKKPSEDKTTTLTYVEPTKSLLVCSMSCENQAATLTNRTVDSMENEDISGVAYRYLQTRRGQRNTFNEAVFWMSCTLVFFTIFSYQHWRILNLIKSNSNEESDKAESAINLLFTFLKLILLVFVANVIPNISNTLRYRKTKNACDAWLEARLNNDTHNKIKQLPNNRNSLFTLNKILKEEKIDTNTLERKILK